MKALGIEGDTPRDTVATLVAQVKQLRTELQTALSDNKSQREENQRLRQRENSIDQRINSALESERSNLRRDQEQAASARQQTEGLLADLQRRLDSIGGRGGGHADLPVGLGLQGGDEAGMEGGVRWVEPDDAKPAEGRNGGRGASGGMSFPRASARRRARSKPPRKPWPTRAPAPLGSRVPSRSIPCRPTPRSWVRSP